MPFPYMIEEHESAKKQGEVLEQATSSNTSASHPKTERKLPGSSLSLPKKSNGVSGMTDKQAS